MDDDGPGFLVDLVDDSEVPASRGEEAFERASERFPDAPGFSAIDPKMVSRTATFTFSGSLRRCRRPSGVISTS